MMNLPPSLKNFFHYDEPRRVCQEIALPQSHYHPVVKDIFSQQRDRPIIKYGFRCRLVVILFKKSEIPKEQNRDDLSIFLPAFMLRLKIR